MAVPPAPVVNPNYDSPKPKSKPKPEKLPEPKSGCTCEPVDYDRIIREVKASIPTPQDGKPGPPGPTAEIDIDELAEKLKSELQGHFEIATQ